MRIIKQIRQLENIGWKLLAVRSIRYLTFTCVRCWQLTMSYCIANKYYNNKDKNSYCY